MFEPLQPVVFLGYLHIKMVYCDPLEETDKNIRKSNKLRRINQYLIFFKHGKWNENNLQRDCLEILKN